MDPGDIDLRGKAKDARLLVAYADAMGASAVPLLERAFREGSPAVRAAALEALAVHAPAVGERLVLDALEHGEDGEAARALVGLVVIGTDATIEAAVELALSWRGPALSLDELPGENLDALLASLALRIARLDENGYRAALFALGLPRALGEADVDHEAHRWFVASILDDERAHPVQREDAARVLLKWRDERSLALLVGHAEMLPIDVALPVFLKREHAEMFDALAPRVRDDGIFRERVLVTLTPASDRRWLEVLRALVDVDPRLALDALCRAGDAETVERLARGPLEEELTTTALHMLASHRHPQAPAILRGWLERPLPPETVLVLLAALGSCGSLDDAAWLEARADVACKQMAALIRNRIAMSGSP